MGGREGGWPLGGRGVVLGSDDVGCYRMICDVAEQRNVNLSSGFRDIYLIAIFFLF